MADFSADAGMSYEQVFNMSFRKYLIPLMKFLEREIGKDKFMKLLEKKSSEESLVVGKSMAEKNPTRDIAFLTESIRKPSPFRQHVVSYEIVEDSENAFEVKVTECLFAKIFRDENASDYGYYARCHGEAAHVKAYNPEIELTMAKTLMQGHECCNPRYELKRET